MRASLVILVLLLLLPFPASAVTEIADDPLQPVEFEFGGYRFGQSPAANMVCSSGFCKSQEPGGDGRMTFPFSVYETPGAVSTLTGMKVVDARYKFWEDHLYRVSFRVDCAPQAPEECLEDLIRSLDREYGLTPLSANDHQVFTIGHRSIDRQFLTSSGALVRVGAALNKGTWQMPNVDIADKAVADRVGTTLSPKFRANKLPLADNARKTY